MFTKNNKITKIFASQTIFKTWIWLYFLLLLIPTVANVFTVSNVYGVLKNELSRNNTVLLKRMSSNLDSAFMEAEYIRSFLNNHVGVNEVAQADELDDSTIFTIYFHLSKLSSAFQSNKYVDSFYIYYPNLDIVVFKSNYYSSAVFYSRFIAQDNKNYEVWIDSLKNSGEMRIFENKITDMTEIKDVITMMIPAYEYSYGSSRKYIIGTHIRKDIVFSDVIGTTPGDAVAVFTDSGSLLFEYGFDGDTLNINNWDLKNEFEIYNGKLGSKKMNISFTRSPVNRYRYLYAAPTNEAIQKIKYTISTVIVTALISSVLMLMILHFFNKWNYGNIKNIIDRIKNIGIGRLDEENEYSLIKNWVNYIEKKEIESNKKLEHLEIIQKNVFLSNFMKGYLNIDEATDEFLRHNISFSYGGFALVAIYINNIGTTGRGILEDATFIVDNITRDLVDDSMNLINIEADGMLYYIVNAHNHIKENVQKLFANVLEFSTETLELVFLTAMSTVASSIHEIPSLYKEVSEAIEFGNFYGVNEFVYYEEINPKAKPQFFSVCNIPNETALIHAIKSENLSEVLEIIDGLLTQKVGEKYLQESQLNCLTYNLINTIIQSTDDTNEEILSYALEITRCTNVKEMKVFFERLINLCVNASAVKKESESGLYQKIKNFVDNHFTEPDLNISYLSYKFNITAAHLAKVFKNNSGIKLNNYINNLRIELAKEMLLRDRTVKIGKIVESSGFSNAKTFQLAFKNIVGVTPTQYRSMK